MTFFNKSLIAQAALADLAKWLDDTKMPSMIIGGVAAAIRSGSDAASFGSPTVQLDAAKNHLQNQQFLPRSIPDRGERNSAIESNQPSFMLNRESKQINVGQLPRSMNSGRIHNFRIQ